MPDVTLSRQSFSDIALPLRTTSGGQNPTRSFGKPELEFNRTGDGLDPRPSSDQWSGSEVISFSSFFRGQSIFGRAHRLADMIKTPSGGSAFTLDMPLPEYESNLSVVPQPNGRALQLQYRQHGTTGHVDIDLTFNRVSAVTGVDDGTRAETPRASGDGPIELRGESSIVQFDEGVTVQRTIGRPAGSLDPAQAMFPAFSAKNESAVDQFGLQLRVVDNAPARTTDILSLFRTRRHRDTLTLDFNGLYGLGAFAVQPAGTRAIEQVRDSDGTDVQAFPQINLRRVIS